MALGSNMKLGNGNSMFSGVCCWLVIDLSTLFMILQKLTSDTFIFHLWLSRERERERRRSRERSPQRKRSRERSPRRERERSPRRPRRVVPRYTVQFSKFSLDWYVS